MDVVAVVLVRKLVSSLATLVEHFDLEKTGFSTTAGLYHKIRVQSRFPELLGDST